MLDLSLPATVMMVVMTVMVMMVMMEAIAIEVTAHVWAAGE